MQQSSHSTRRNFNHLNRNLSDQSASYGKANTDIPDVLALYIEIEADRRSSRLNSIFL